MEDRGYVEVVEDASHVLEPTVEMVTRVDLTEPTLTGLPGCVDKAAERVGQLPVVGTPS